MSPRCSILWLVLLYYYLFMLWWLFLFWLYLFVCCCYRIIIVVGVVFWKLLFYGGVVVVVVVVAVVDCCWLLLIVVDCCWLLLLVVDGYSPTQRPGEVVHFYFSDVSCTRTHLLLRNLIFLTLEDMKVLHNRMSVVGVFVFGWGVGWVGCFRSLHLHASWCYATWCFLHGNTSSLLRNLMFLTLEDVSVLRHRMSVGGVFVFGWGWGGVGWVGCIRSLHLHASWCYATWCFLHGNTSWCYATRWWNLQHSQIHARAEYLKILGQSLLHGWKKEFGAFWQKFQRYSTLELLESICTSMEHWREKPSDDDDFLIKRNFF